MNGALHRRVSALEAGPASCRSLLSAFAICAEAQADSEPTPGVTVLRIVTGVPRAHLPDAAA